jgi:glyoxylase-like metal-dependent hydrolase (beta-lactamase superfamily II)
MWPAPMRSADGWFEVAEVDDGVFRITETLGEADRFGPALTHSYVVLGGVRALVVDASHGIGDLRAAVGLVTALPLDVAITHYHFDHVGCAHQFPRVAVPAAEAELLTGGPTPEMAELTARVRGRCTTLLPPGFTFDAYRGQPITPSSLLAEGDVIDLGGRSLRVLHTPGHSPGSLCFHDPASGLMFTGDTLNRGLISLNLELCDIAAHGQSVRRLSGVAPGLRWFLPAHYATPAPPRTGAELLAAVESVLRHEAPLVRHPHWVQADFGSCAITLPVDFQAGAEFR